MDNDYAPILERISKGCFTIDDLASEYTDINKDELEETLEGYVAFKKISKTRHFFHGNTVVPPEKKSRTTTGNSLDCTNIEYPEWVKSDRDRVKFLASPESPKLVKPMNFFIDDIDCKDTGKILFDSLNSNHIMTSVFMSPNTNEPGNKVDYSKDITQARGFSIIHRDGEFQINVSLLKALRPRYANSKTDSEVDCFKKNFKTFEDFKKWLMENL